jgi:hypothetical protein
MTENELLHYVQASADKTSENFVFKRTAKLELVYSETLEDGSVDCYCLGADMPSLVYRVFNVKENGETTEYGDIKVAVDKTRHYNIDVKPALGLEKAPLITGETGEYEIVLENKLENNGVEIKLKSSIGRDITMIEIYRYFDYVSKVYYVSCVALSFGGQYLFSVTPDNKHLRLIVGNNEEIRKRVDMMTELLQAHLLPSYQTIAAGAQILANGKANITLNGANGEKTDFESNFCYDDPETQTRFVFFAKKGDPKQGVILVEDIFTQQLSMSDKWTDEQKAAVDKFKALMKDNPDEFSKHTVSFFADDLDFRYNAFKNGTLKPQEQPVAPAPEQKAE